MKCEVVGDSSSSQVAGGDKSTSPKKRTSTSTSTRTRGRGAQERDEKPCPCMFILQIQGGGAKKPMLLKLEVGSKAEAKQWIAAIDNVPGGHRKAHEFHDD